MSSMMFDMNLCIANETHGIRSNLLSIQKGRKQFPMSRASYPLSLPHQNDQFSRHLSAWPEPKNETHETESKK
jgi:hypothetical protein